jgi:hypothetical protein
MNQQEGISPDQFRANHLKQRLAEVVSEYEEKISRMALQIQALSQAYDELRVHAQRLEEEQNERPEPDEDESN